MSGITPEIREDVTPGQEKQLVRVMLDQLEKSGCRHKAAVDRILSRGNELAAVLVPLFTRLGSDIALVDSALLEPITMVAVPGAKSFSVADYFHDGETVQGVKVWLGENFKAHFLGKVESDVPEETLRVHQLRQRSVDGPILRELGGEAQVTMAVAHLWQLLKQQARGQRGVLLTDGSANIFYIEDADGSLWAVFCYWDADLREWHVKASPVSRPYEWNAGVQVFSS